MRRTGWRRPGSEGLYSEPDVEAEDELEFFIQFQILALKHAPCLRPTVLALLLTLRHTHTQSKACMYVGVSGVRILSIETALVFQKVT